MKNFGRPFVCALALAAMTPFVASVDASAMPIIAPGPSILGTKVVPIRASRFESSWQRANQDASALPMMKALIRPALAMTQAQKIEYVQSVVTKNIRWQSDATNWKKHDYWASAAETLSSGAGDAEDRAIVKLQALKALGIKAEDLFLTMARDSVGGPMTVVSVRQGDRFLILADTGKPFLAASRQFEFNPLISFGHGGAWMHVKQAMAKSKAKASTVSAALRN